jgi:hypothetical protein
MSCKLCGEGDPWIKTYLASDGSRLRVCDPCHQTRAPELISCRDTGWSRPAATPAAAMTTPGSLRRPSLAAARTPTRGRAGRARRRGIHETGGAPLAARLPPGQERPGPMGVTEARRLGGGLLQRPGRHQGGHRGSRLESLQG